MEPLPKAQEEESDYSFMNDLPPLDVEMPALSSEEDLHTQTEDMAEDGHGGIQLSMEIISRYFHLTSQQAADALNIGDTKLKKSCRRVGIQRWPRDKYKSIDIVRTYIKELQSRGEAGDVPQEAEQLLEKETLKLQKDPNVELDSWIQEFRKKAQRANYNTKRRKRGKGSANTSRPVAVGHVPPAAPERPMAENHASSTDHEERGLMKLKTVSDLYYMNNYYFL